MSFSLSALRYAFRSLLRTPGFSLAVMLTLGLGLGLNATVLSAVYDILLRPLDLPQPERLYAIGQNMEKRGRGQQEATSRRVFTEWRARNRSFAGVAFYMDHNADLSDADPPENVAAGRVSHEFFSVLGVHPARGRVFLKEEETKGRDTVAVLSHGLWQRRFGGDPLILGKTIMANGSPLTVVGILPPGFRSPVLPGAELWVPMALDPPAKDMGYSYARVFGRLKPGISTEEAQADMDRVAASMAADFPERLHDIGATLTSLRDAIAGRARMPLLLLLGTASLVLLIACVNVGNLFLTRVAARQGELALRMAVGAGRGRVVWLFVLEGMLLTLGGAAVGLLLSSLGLAFLRGLAPPQWPRLDSVRVESAAFAGIAALSLAASLIAGLLPAAWSWRRRPFEPLREGSGATAGRSALRWRNALVVAEIAASIILLIGAGSLLRTLLALSRVDPGLRIEKTVQGNLLLPPSRYPGDHDVADFLAQLEERLEQQPDIAAAGMISSTPLAEDAFETKLVLEGRSASDADPPTARFRVASPGFFRSVGLRLVAGRFFIASDTAASSPVVLVNERFVRRYLDGASPLGRRLRIPESEGPEAPWRAIVGIGGDFHGQALDHPPEPELFIPMAQQPLRVLTVVARARSSPRAALKALQDVANELRPRQIVSHRETLEDVLGRSLSPRRFVAGLTATFAAIALLLAAIGIYGVVALAVSQRRREIAVRLALGASPSSVAGMILRGNGVLLASGVLIGLAGSFAVRKALAAFLFGVQPMDGLTVAAAIVFLSIVVFSATLPVALRAGRMDAARILKGEG
jgi:predicted permease